MKKTVKKTAKKAEKKNREQGDTIRENVAWLVGEGSDVLNQLMGAIQDTQAMSKVRALSQIPQVEELMLLTTAAERAKKLGWNDVVGWCRAEIDRLLGVVESDGLEPASAPEVTSIIPPEPLE